MFIILSKIIPPLLYPLGSSCILIVAAICLSRKNRLQRWFLVIAFLLLFLGGNRWVAWGLTRSLEWRYLPPSEIPRADVIVVLGGATHSASYPRQMVEIDSAGDRILYAFSLYQQGKAEHLLLTGGAIEWMNSDINPATDMASLFEVLGISRNAFWLVTDSRNTYEDALYSAKLLREKGISRIILVTSAIHMPRSVGLFEKQGLEVIPAPTDFTVTQQGWQNLIKNSISGYIFNFLPSAENLSTTNRALKEYLGILVYGINGWL